MSRAFNHPATADLTMDNVLHALSDPARREIMVKLLSCNSMNCSQACEDKPASTISHHHKILRDAGLIRSEKTGVAVMNSARREDIDARFPGLLQAILFSPATPNNE